MTTVITIASGQAGAGKTSIGVNLALCLSQQGKKICLFDAPLGLDVIQSLLGVNPDGSLKEVMGPRRNLADVLVKDYHGIDVLLGSPAIEQLQGLNAPAPRPTTRLFDALQEYDYLLIDTSAGLSRTTLAFCLAATEVMLVVTPKSVALTNVYSLVRMLHRNGFSGVLTAVVNRCENIDAGRHAYGTLYKVAKDYADVDIPLLGLVFEDAGLDRSTAAGQAVVLGEPESVASRCIRNLATRLVEERPALSNYHDMQSFWSRLFRLLSQPLIIPRSGRDVETLAAQLQQAGADVPLVTGRKDRRPSPVVRTPINQLIAAVSGWFGSARKPQATYKAKGSRHRFWRSRLVDNVDGTKTMTKVLRNYPYQRRQVGYRKAKMDVYYVDRDTQSPLTCAFHGSSEAEEPGLADEELSEHRQKRYRR